MYLLFHTAWNNSFDQSDYLINIFERKEDAFKYIHENNDFIPNDILIRKEWKETTIQDKTFVSQRCVYSRKVFESLECENNEFVSKWSYVFIIKKSNTIVTKESKDLIACFLEWWECIDEEILLDILQSKNLSHLCKEVSVDKKKTAKQLKKEIKVLLAKLADL